MTQPARYFDARDDDALPSKVPQVTAWFWAVKILATTAGETGGDALSMTLNLGYAVATLVFLAFFVVTLALQVRASRYHPLTYWTVVVATTTVGTTTSDFIDRTLGLGYVTSSALLLAGVIAVLVVWRLVTGRIEYERIADRRDEVFYWVAIVVANTLGTALGDFVASSAGFGFEVGALVFASLLSIVAAIGWIAPRTWAGVLFWSAYVLTRPLGATLGDTLTKPYEDGGFALDRISATLTIVAVMAALVVVQRRRERRTQRAAACPDA
ncbi:COG4705 family protein [Paraburkholderia caballeronis]|uniref:Uncharacterized membrane-anchored protein n=1 Tax=Paraburkholderia caballeronis TaxID=416943 RepID=A0A1H7RKD9_9BURK|nr:hypothetical protein [Paraburkholderia caballeronis]PXW23043.1 putative membrane-anchored protein [Paraburkholderia caballeronis]PXW97707.1 putative membrane-anchored protein [Paraburkholderia caballeronis]RAJ94677.1 putative membrane-anchored protein [Paraburkholderia caballeronis]SEE82126.1 Uncharacterized membrane-anchored protein [Paraburkholderia caballeronis]SEL59857.1 Uncharacterized membrane-anchored protein [Paraburkholderia caballeronis]